MLKARTRWLLPNANPKKEEDLAQELKVSPLTARLLVHRGFAEPESASEFLHPDVGQLVDPTPWEGMDYLLHWFRKETHIEKKIGVIGSNRADGICSASILLHIFEEIGAKVTYFMFPKREQFALESFIREEIQEMDLLFLTDLSLSTHSPEWEGALSLWSFDQSGDQKILGGQPIISFNPHSNPFPIRDLSSSGWAFKLGQALLGEPPCHLLDLAMLGTIASEVPLVGENRVIVKYGLDRINKPSPSAGVRVWKEECQLSTVSVMDIKEVMIPWIEQTLNAVSMLSEKDYRKAKQLAIHRTEFLGPNDGKNDSYFPVDAWCHLSEINVKAIEELERLAPFGPGNEEPIFILNGVSIVNVRTAGLDQSHFKCQLKEGDLSIDATGFGLGRLSVQLAKQAMGNVIGQWVLHEWNGIRKPHFLIKDLSISHTQIFDFRGTKDKEKILRSFLEMDSLILCFRKDSLRELDSFQSEETPCPSILYAYTESLPIEQNVSHLFLYDLPYSISEWEDMLIRIPQPQRVYCLFGAEHQNDLAVIPAREHFKWLYGVLKKKGYGKWSWIPALAKSRGISEHAIRFMLAVFLDLEFIRNRGETMTIEESPNKRELAESLLYQKKKQEMEIETELLYSSFEDLCLTFKKLELLIKKAP